MDRVKVIEYAGKKVVYIDFSRCDSVETLSVIDSAAKLIRGQPPASVLTLTDVTNMAVDDRSTKAMHAYVAANKPFVKASAVVGASGLVRAVLGTIRMLTRREIASFPIKEAALAWLVKH